MNLRKSRHWSKKTKQKWDVTMPMVTWVKSWRKLVTACKMPGFRFHDLRHTFRTQGAEAGVPFRPTKESIDIIEFASQNRILLDIRHDPPILSIQSKCRWTS
jgi:integrase